MVERLPWTGDAFTLSTLSLAAGIRPPVIMALIGLPDAGKTTFLTTFYSRIRREPLGERQFAGSMTLRGWEVLNRHLMWLEGTPPTYPPRTSGAQRTPGLLHLAVRGDGDQLTDVVLADTPGEWFLKFSRDASIAGARTTLQLADGLILAIDPGSLTADAQERHAMKRNLLNLLARVSEVVPGKPLNIVLTRADQAVEETDDLREILERAREAFPSLDVHHTSSAFEAAKTPQAGVGVLEAVDSLLRRLEQRSASSPLLPERHALLARLIEEEA